MLENGRFPRVFGWKELLQAHIDHEKEIYRRGFEFDLKKIQNRLHIIEGLLKAYDMIDEVIQTIKTAADTKSANIALQKLLQIDETQAKAILDLKLSKLSKLDIGKLVSEQDELTQRASHILEILNSTELFNNELIKGWHEVAEKFGDSRRTRILNLSEDNNETIEVKSLMANLTNENNLFIEETSSLYSQRRGGVGSKFKLGKNEYVTTSTTCQNTDNLLFFTQKGNVYAYEAGALPIGEKIAVESLFAISTNEKVCAITNLSNSNPARHIVFITKNGMLKKSLLSEYNIKRAKNGIKALELNPNDEVNSILFMNEEKLGAMNIVPGKYNASKLRYGKIAICSDSDSDGYHIGLLIMAAIHYLAPQFLEEGRLCWLRSPLFIVKKGKEETYFFTEEEFNKQRNKIKGEVSRAKGLGALSPEQAKKSMFDPQYQKMDILEPTEESLVLLEQLMGKEVEPRRDYIFSKIDFSTIRE